MRFKYLSYPTKNVKNNIVNPSIINIQPAGVTNFGENHRRTFLVTDGKRILITPFKRESHPKISTTIEDTLIDVLFNSIMKNPVVNAKNPEKYMSVELFETSSSNKIYSFLLRRIETPTTRKRTLKKYAKTKDKYSDMILPLLLSALRQSYKLFHFRIFALLTWLPTSVLLCTFSRRIVRNFCSRLTFCNLCFLFCHGNIRLTFGLGERVP